MSVSFDHRSTDSHEIQMMPGPLRHLFPLWITCAGYVLLPPLLTYGTIGTPYEPLFRPQPANNFYDAMLVTIAWSMSGVLGWMAFYAPDHCPQWHGWSRKARRDLADTTSHGSFSAIHSFHLLWALVLSITYFIGGSPASGSIWLVFALCNGVFTLPSLTYSLSAFTPFRSRSILDWIYSVFIGLFAIGFIAFPVAQPWDNPARYIRWHPYSVRAEVIWRGNFFVYAMHMLLTSLVGPRKCAIWPFVLFFGVSCALHGLVMMGMNVGEHLSSGLNGNLEHLYTEVVFFCLIGILSIGMGISGWRTQRSIAKIDHISR